MEWRYARCDTVPGVRPRLLLVPSFTELEWGIRPELEEWAEVVSFDCPGVGGNEIPFEIEFDKSGVEAYCFTFG